MYLCLDCENIFDTPKSYIETHGLDSPPYETFDGCLNCGGAYVKTMECASCGEWVAGEYIKLKDGTVICDNCYEPRNILDD